MPRQPAGCLAMTVLGPGFFFPLRTGVVSPQIQSPRRQYRHPPFTRGAHLDTDRPSCSLFQNDSIVLLCRKKLKKWRCLYPPGFNSARCFPALGPQACTERPLPKASIGAEEGKTYLKGAHGCSAPIHYSLLLIHYSSALATATMMAHSMRFLKRAQPFSYTPVTLPVA